MPETVAQVKRNATARLLAIPGVAAVGVGQKVIAGRHTGEPAIKVYLRNKLPLADVPPDEVIPPTIDGVPTDVEVGGDPVPIVDPVDRPGVSDLRAQLADLTSYRAVVGGGRIVTVGGCPGGTGGCLLWDPDDHDVGFLLTAFHVIKAGDIATVTQTVTKVGQPTGQESSSKCCNDVVGVFAGGDQTAERDEALVKLNPGLKWKAQIADIGMVAGKHTLTQADVTVAGSPYKVAKRGQTSKVTGGTIGALNATTTEADNLIIVHPNPNPADPIGLPFFAIEGDSGSALVNAANEVVGVVWGRDRAGNGYAYHIDHVLQRFQTVEELTVEVARTTDPDEEHEVPGATHTVVPPEIAERIAADPDERRAFTGTGDRAPLASPWFADIVPSPGTVASVLVDLHGSDAGRLLLDLWDRHGTEARDLVEHDRRVLLAWHRGGGAALMQLILRLPGDPGRSLPETLNGRPLMDCVDGIVAALTRAGSRELGAALARARTALPDLAGLTYSEIVADLRAAAGVEELIVDG